MARPLEPGDGVGGPRVRGDTVLRDVRAVTDEGSAGGAARWGWPGQRRALRGMNGADRFCYGLAGVLAGAMPSAPRRLSNRANITDVVNAVCATAAHAGVGLVLVDEIRMFAGTQERSDDLYAEGFKIVR